MSRPTGATHQHQQTKRYYRQDRYGSWQYWDGDIWCYSICVTQQNERLKQLD